MEDLDSNEVCNGLKNWSEGPQCSRVQRPRKYTEKSGIMLTLTSENEAPDGTFLAVSRAKKRSALTIMMLPAGSS